MEVRRALACVAPLALAACATATPPLPPPEVSVGPLVAEVTATRALLWARGNRVGRLHAAVQAEGETELRRPSVPVFRADDWTGQIELEGLRPDTEYRYEVRLLVPGVEGELASPPVTGRFRTAPAVDEPASLRLAFSGDLAGQNVCRDQREGFPIFHAISAAEPDLFVGLGDMVYADGICTEVGFYGNPQVPGDFPPSARVVDFWAHWRYARKEKAFAALLASVPYVAVWDDHEVVNDFGPHDDTRDTPPYTPGEPLMPLGLAAFLDYNPIPDRDAAAGRLYRSLRWGRHLELFVLDTRQYRDAAAEPDDPEHPKSLLGAEQREWLEQALTRSDATWKVIVTSVPLSIPTGRPEARDGWTAYGRETGYENELRGLLAFLRDADVRNTLWITTDVHFGAVFRYTPFPEDPEFQTYEVVTGPLNAGLFGHDRFDESLGAERLFYYGPEDFRKVAGWEEARRFFNFGLLDFDAEGGLVIRIVNVDGEQVYELALPAAGG